MEQINKFKYRYRLLNNFIIIIQINDIYIWIYLFVPSAGYILNDILLNDILNDILLNDILLNDI